jgi:FkbM family methyltransferase
MLGGRSPGFVLRQATEPENYRALLRMRGTVLHPLDFAGRYFFGRGEYPVSCPVRTPAGVIAPKVYSHHDVFTINEIFCRLDYRLDAGARTVVDIGSNIGISALYFLTRSPGVRCHLFEPDPRNVERLLENLKGYQERFELTESAVSDCSGRVSFGREPSGRYGGVGIRHPDEIEVDCLAINDVLRGVLEREDRVDMLKIDTEGLENRTVQAIEPELLEKIATICFETTEPINPAPEQFVLRYATDTARLVNRKLIGAAI